MYIVKLPPLPNHCYIVNLAKMIKLKIDKNKSHRFSPWESWTISALPCQVDIDIVPIPSPGWLVRNVPMSAVGKCYFQLII